jgi:N-methylhydantoinase B
MHVSQSATRIAPTEVWESRNPWLIERVELGQDSGGAGRHRGGNGLDMDFRLLEDAELTSVIDRTRTPPAGLAGGSEARPNGAVVILPDGTRVPCSKTTRLAMPEGTLLQLRTGGGGGYGDPAERDPEAVRADLLEGYVSEERARLEYPHAFTPRS